MPGEIDKLNAQIKELTHNLESKEAELARASPSKPADPSGALDRSVGSRLWE